MNALKTVNKKAILDLAAANDVNQRFFEALSRRSKNSAVTTVEQAMQFAKGTRPEIVELFRLLDEIELGNFWVGRRGARSRFEWTVRLTDVGQAYAGEIDEIEPAGQEDLEEDIYAPGDEEIDHEYTLRPDHRITFSLPADLTRREAKRLADFINTLPFDEE